MWEGWRSKNGRNPLLPAQPQCSPPHAILGFTTVSEPSVLYVGRKGKFTTILLSKLTYAPAFTLIHLISSVVVQQTGLDAALKAVTSGRGTPHSKRAGAQPLQLCLAQSQNIDEVVLRHAETFRKTFLEEMFKGGGERKHHQRRRSGGGDPSSRTASSILDCIDYSLLSAHASSLFLSPSVPPSLRLSVCLFRHLLRSAISIFPFVADYCNAIVQQLPASFWLPALQNCNRTATNFSLPPFLGLELEERRCGIKKKKKKPRRKEDVEELFQCHFCEL
ncbi:hypothetical protein FQA47_017003 [Oryzias melastigma]|uniref:Uncharacterized protein n=1 Tax=Oryzias melastigma TaxID=30732 RepID=A0A834EZC9_ORYME|nr:hypothetical protein FQA47_017003 [Oryzias melastigma]